MSEEGPMYEPDTTAEETAQAARNLFDEFIQHEQRAFEETGAALESLIPPGFREHGREAAEEFVKGFRVLFNAAANGVQVASKEFDKGLNRVRPQGDGGERPSSTGPTKVKVQVE